MNSFCLYPRTMNLSDRPLLRLITLCILYVAQGIPWGFVSVTFATFLASQGKSIETIGTLTAMATLPWTFKWVWGPFIDRFGIPSMGRRRPWILAAQLGMIGTIVAMAFVENPSEHVATITWLVFVHNIFNSLQDVSVDALAVDLLEESERGRANGFMYGSKSFGIFLGGAFLSRMVINDSDFTVVYLIQILMLSLIMLFPLLLRERAGEKLLPWMKGQSQLKVGEELADNTFKLFMYLKRAFSLKSTLLTAIVGFTIFIAGGLLSPITKALFIQDLGWARTDLTDIEGGYGMFFGLAGAIIGGLLADKFGAKRIATLGSITLALAYLIFGLSSPENGIISWFDWNDKPIVISYVLLTQCMENLISASMFAMCMTVSWPKVAGTQFTAYMAILNLSTATGLKFSGWLSDQLSLPTIFMALAIIQFAVIFIFPFIDVHQARRVLGQEK